ncbi:hypothetical protein LENED_004783 [Lentinula edodes]|uniref:Uncharacterized protein n=1 Tax=Lentinula edodes TaxID=5353 RepID=A0A1Q3E798_LENED|nr:hypothetical protein LENED_004783 [Lentinula edodes]
MAQVRNKDGLKFDAFRTLSLNESAKPHRFIVSKCEGNSGLVTMICSVYQTNEIPPVPISIQDTHQSSSMYGVG